MTAAKDPTRPSAPRRVAAVVRQERALTLRARGMTFREIAADLGVALGYAHKLVKGALKERLALVGTAVDELRAVEVVAIDALQHGLWPAASKGDVRAVDSITRLMARRAALLGLDSPQKSEVNLGGALQFLTRAQMEDEVRERVARLAVPE